MRKTSILLTSAFIIASILITPKYVFASGTIGGSESISVGTPEYPSNPATNSNGENACTATSAGTFGDAWCDYAVGTDIRSDVYLDLYDRAGKYLGNVITAGNQKVLAGTFIGIDFFEKYQKKVTVYVYPRCYNVTVTLTCKVEYDCLKDCYGNPIGYDGEKVIPKQLVLVEGAFGGGGGGGGGSSSSDDDDDDEKKCNSYWDTCTRTETVTSGSCPAGTVSSTPSCKYNGCTPPNPMEERWHNGALALLNTNLTETQPSYSAVRQDSNDANYKNAKGENEISVAEYYDNVTEGPYTEDGGLKVWKRLTQNIKYNLQRACLNVKTGKVRYTTFDDSCSSDTELTIPEAYNNQTPKTRIGWYFIPLNAKSNQNVTYVMAARQKRSKGVCENIIDSYSKDKDKYERWRVLLLDQNMEPFSSTISATDAKKKVANGCYYSGVASFEVVQKFYNETSSNKLKGYGFFYRPIDVSNPFPNELTNSTYWGKEGLYNSVNNTVTVDGTTTDLDNSFSTVTYTALIKNPDSVRNYNKDNLYMSWENMNISGTSQFINNSGYITRNGTQSFYRLGCGPANSTWIGCGNQ